MAQEIVQLQVSDYSQLSVYIVRIEFCRLISAKYSSLCTNHIWGNCNDCDKWSNYFNLWWLGSYSRKKLTMLRFHVFAASAILRETTEHPAPSNACIVGPAWIKSNNTRDAKLGIHWIKSGQKANYSNNSNSKSTSSKNMVEIIQRFIKLTAFKNLQL